MPFFGMFWQNPIRSAWLGKRNFVCKMACAQEKNVIYYFITIFREKGWSKAYE